MPGRSAVRPAVQSSGDGYDGCSRLAGRGRSRPVLLIRGIACINRPPAFQRSHNTSKEGETMKARSLIANVAILAAAGLATSAEAQQAKAKDTQTISGCTRAVVPFCMTTSYRGTTYVLHGISPITVPDNTFIRVKGRTTGTLGICPGTQMQVISWSKGRGACR
jgi:hypothetical protein